MKTTDPQLHSRSDGNSTVNGPSAGVSPIGAGGAGQPPPKPDKALGEHPAAKTRPVVRDHRDRRRRVPDYHTVGVDYVHTPRSSRRSSGPVSRFPSATPSRRQVRASATRAVGVTVAAWQHFVA
jgi:hypothetical protein